MHVAHNIKFMNNIRELEIEDYNKGFLQLLNQLTNIGDYNYEKFEKVFEIYKKTHDLIIVIENNNKIIATGKILIEYKFHNNMSYLGHIEDIVVDENYRKYGIGKKIVEYLIDYGLKNDCYKVTLNCSDKNVEFYEKCGFKKKSNEMVIYKNCL